MPPYGGLGESRTLRVRILYTIGILSSPVLHKGIVVLRFADRDPEIILIDLIQSGYLEVKGCGPRLAPDQI
jgi:hypothetical protein